MAKTRATDIEKEERLFLIEKMILQGKRLPEIKKIVNGGDKEKGFNWGILDRQIENYFYEAKRAIGTVLTKDEIKERLVLVLKRYDELFERSCATRDYRTAAMINDKTANLLNLPEVSREILEIEPNSTQMIINFKQIDEPN